MMKNRYYHCFEQFVTTKAQWYPFLSSIAYQEDFLPLESESAKKIDNEWGESIAFGTEFDLNLGLVIIPPTFVIPYFESSATLWKTSSSLIAQLVGKLSRLPLDAWRIFLIFLGNNDGLNWRKYCLASILTPYRDKDYCNCLYYWRRILR